VDDAAKAEFFKKLQSPIGATGTPNPARDAVNQAMIRHWCDSMEDANPNYTDPEAAAAGPHGQIVAPPMMLNAWTMLGNIPRPVDPNDPQGVVGRLLDDAGYIGVVATNCEHVYPRYLKLGDQITGTQKLVDVSEEKQTGLGTGHFVTTETQYHDQHGEHVGSMFFRILKFKPGTGRPVVGGATETGERRRRPRPGMNQDTAFFWNGLRAGELRIQRCEDCGALEHPPTVRCLTCGSTNRGYLVASGRGHLYSYVVAHHPQVPSFDYPLNIGLVELEEGIRLVTNVVSCTDEQLEIGMPVELCLLDSHDDITLHQFRPARIAARTTTLGYDDVNVGDKLPLCPVPITPTLIVSTAIASRDYQDVHHDRDQARRKGSKDIFMNILTSSGLSGRYVTDWAGPGAVLKNMKIRLGAPNYPYDTMTMSGSVAKKEIAGGEGIVQVAFEGRNSLGAHVTGTIDLALPKAG
jgi:uncharacterized OB-fold protein/acyl dehydratase